MKDYVIRLFVSSFLWGFVRGACDLDQSFDYFMLALQWPPHFGVSLDHWTIHGLWPSRVGPRVHSYPCDCSAEKLNLVELEPILNEMRLHWPTLFTKNTNEWFWDHEWSKHGTCSHFPSQLSYFNTTLGLRSALDPRDALDKGGILPDLVHAYSASAIQQAFRKSHNAEPLLGCKTLDGKQMLAEVGFCFSQELKLISECDKSVERVHDEVNDCRMDQEIYLQPTQQEAVVVVE